MTKWLEDTDLPAPKGQYDVHAPQGSSVVVLCSGFSSCPSYLLTPQHWLLRLRQGLAQVQKDLDSHYTVFAGLLTDFKMDNPDKKSEEFKKLLGSSKLDQSHHICACMEFLSLLLFNGALG